jgi:hypothetical protein
MAASYLSSSWAGGNFCCIKNILAGVSRPYVRAFSLAVLALSGGGALTAAASEATAQELEWATRPFDISSTSRIIVIATDAPGNSYLTGSFFGTATFGAGEDNETVLTSARSFDLFVAKYDRNGLLVWARKDGGTSVERGIGIATDAHGNSYVTGQFSETAGFGFDEDNATVLTSTGGAEPGLDIVVAKYGRDGKLIWAKQAGAPDIFIDPDRIMEGSSGISIDPSGNSYVTGAFYQPSITFGAGEDNETVLTAANGGFFVAKYDRRNGGLIWAKLAGVVGVGVVQVLGIAADAHGNSYISDNYSASVTFGVGEDNETVFSASPIGSSTFIAKYDRDGQLIWVKQVAKATTFGVDIAIDNRGASYITGSFRGTVTSGVGEDNETVLSASPLGSNTFIAKYDRNDRLIWAKQAGAPRSPCNRNREPRQQLRDRRHQQWDGDVWSGRGQRDRAHRRPPRYVHREV